MRLRRAEVPAVQPCSPHPAPHSPTDLLPLPHGVSDSRFIAAVLMTACLQFTKSCCPSRRLHLHRRVHELEEQVKDAEAKADQNLEEETKRHREAYSKMERDRNLEIDLLCNR